MEVNAITSLTTLPSGRRPESNANNKEQIWLKYPARRSRYCKSQPPPSSSLLFLPFYTEALLRYSDFLLSPLHYILVMHASISLIHKKKKVFMKYCTIIVFLMSCFMFLKLDIVTILCCRHFWQRE